VLDEVRRCEDIGIEQLSFDFGTGRVDEMLVIMAFRRRRDGAGEALRRSRGPHRTITPEWRAGEP